MVNVSFQVHYLGEGAGRDPPTRPEFQHLGAGTEDRDPALQFRTIDTIQDFEHGAAEPSPSAGHHEVPGRIGEGGSDIGQGPEPACRAAGHDIRLLSSFGGGGRPDRPGLKIAERRPVF